MSLRRRLSNSLLPWLALFCLLGAQQAAYAHALSHLVLARTAAVQMDGDDRGTAAREIAAVCPSCAAFAGLDAAAPSTAAAVVAGDATTGALPSRLLPCAATFVSGYQARAPPARL